MIPAVQQIPLFEKEILTFLLLVLTICTGFFLRFSGEKCRQELKELKSRFNASENSKNELEKVTNKTSKIEAICESSLKNLEYLNKDNLGEYYISIVKEIYDLIKEEKSPATQTNQVEGKVVQRKFIRRN